MTKLKFWKTTVFYKLQPLSRLDEDFFSIKKKRGSSSFNLHVSLYQFHLAVRSGIIKCEYGLNVLTYTVKHVSLWINLILLCWLPVKMKVISTNLKLDIIRHNYIALHLPPPPSKSAKSSQTVPPSRLLLIY